MEYFTGSRDRLAPEGLVERHVVGEMEVPYVPHGGRAGHVPRSLKSPTPTNKIKV